MNKRITVVYEVEFVGDGDNEDIKKVVQDEASIWAENTSVDIDDVLPPVVTVEDING